MGWTIIENGQKQTTIADIKVLAKEREKKKRQT